MKKSELTQLTQVIEHLVAKEVRKQLPAIIAETFQNMMGKSVVIEQRQAPQPIREEVEPQENRIGDEEIDFKTSLRELFAGTPVMKSPVSPQNQPMKQFAKDPKINQILNETVSDLRYREGLVGGAAMAGGYSPSLNLIPGFNPNVATLPIEEEVPGPSFMKNAPAIPRSRPPQVFQEGVIPAASVPIGTPPAVAHALTKNYSQMMKLIDKKKKGMA